jgi:hypothetical protein
MRGGPEGKGQAADYRILILGRLDRRWTGYFPELSIRSTTAPDGMEATCLSGTITDQSALRGILCRIWDLGLTVSGIERLTAGSEERNS